jgi:hypothetical protein
MSHVKWVPQRDINSYPPISCTEYSGETTSATEKLEKCEYQAGDFVIQYL